MGMVIILSLCLYPSTFAYPPSQMSVLYVYCNILEQKPARPPPAAQFNPIPLGIGIRVSYPDRLHFGVRGPFMTSHPVYRARFSKKIIFTSFRPFLCSDLVLTLPNYKKMENSKIWSPWGCLWRHNRRFSTFRAIQRVLKYLIINNISYGYLIRLKFTARLNSIHPTLFSYILLKLDP